MRQLTKQKGKKKNKVVGAFSYTKIKVIWSFCNRGLLFPKKKLTENIYIYTIKHKSHENHEGCWAFFCRGGFPQKIFTENIYNETIKQT